MLRNCSGTGSHNGHEGEEGSCGASSHVGHESEGEEVVAAPAAM
jgi:hypothetical protein